MIKLMRDRATDKVKEWSKEIKQDKERRYNESRRKIGDLSKEITGYFASKAKGRKYFY